MNAKKQALLTLTATAVGMLAGCSWFGSEEPVRPVSPLQDIASPVTAQIAWTKDTGSGSEGLRLVPAWAGGRLFVADKSGVVMALDANGGGTLWSQDTDARVTGGVGAGAGLVLVGTAEGRVIALEQATGAERWRQDVSSEVLAAPAAARDVVVVRTNDGKVVGLGAADGAERWSYEREVPVLSLRGAAAPVIAGDYVICGLDSGKLVSLDLATGRAVWDVTIAFPSGRSDLERVVDIDAEPLVAGDALFVTAFQGGMAGVSLTTGAIGWTHPFSSYTGFSADRRALYASDENGFVWSVEPASGEARWTQKALSGRHLSGTATAGGWVVVGDLEGYVHWLDSETGAIAGRTKVVDSPIVARPLVAADGLVYVLGSEGELAALRPPVK